MSQDPQPLVLEEYRSLRATIRERGTARLFVVTITFVAWALLLVLTPVRFDPTLPSLVPLLVLAVGFEVSFAAHVGAERVGRYVQVRFEGGDASGPAWEKTIMALGPDLGRGSLIDPLLTMLFALAAVIGLAWSLSATDLGSAAPRGGVLENAWLGVVAHAAFGLRLLHARRYAARQRVRDLALFDRR